jgi:1-phosphofructokinase family hexose kinase
MILTVTPNPCVDKTVFVDHLAVGGKTRAPRYACIPGGKGTNVARAAKALGYDSAAFVVVGGHTGRHVVEMIEQQDGVRCIPAWVAGATRTITTVLEESIHRQTAIFEPGSEVTEAELAAMLELFAKVVPEASVVTFNGTVCHPVLRPLYRDMIAEAKRLGKKTVLDAYGPEFEAGLLSGPDLIKPNVTEAEQLLGMTIHTESDQWEAVRRFHDQGVPNVVLSLGEDGALASDGIHRWHGRPPRIDAVNEVGSGDSLVAGLAIGLQEGWPLDQALRLGIAAGTANAMSWDIAHFTRAEVNAVWARVEVVTV